jgi:TRAP-type C4-dicarboxylate transport system substrate-binding protein
MRRGIGRQALALLVIATLWGCSSGDQTIQVRMATLFSSSHYLAKKLEWTAAELEKRSEGRFKCQVFAGSVMGGEKENLEDLLLGNLELMNSAGSYFYRYVPEAAVVELPLYGWEDREECHCVVRGVQRFLRTAGPQSIR